MKRRILTALCPFWRGATASRIAGTKLWRVEVTRKKGMSWRETKACAYAVLDVLCADFSVTCVVSVR